MKYSIGDDGTLHKNTPSSQPSKNFDVDGCLDGCMTIVLLMLAVVMPFVVFFGGCEVIEIINYWPFPLKIDSTINDIYMRRELFSFSIAYFYTLIINESFLSGKDEYFDNCNCYQFLGIIFCFLTLYAHDDINYAHDDIKISFIACLILCIGSMIYIGWKAVLED